MGANVNVQLVDQNITSSNRLPVDIGTTAKITASEIETLDTVDLDATYTANADVFASAVAVPDDGTLSVQFLPVAAGVVTLIIIRGGKTLSGTLDNGNTLVAGAWFELDIKVKNGDTAQLKFSATTTVSALLALDRL